MKKLKLYKDEFWNVYGISILSMNSAIDRSELLVYLLEIAEKYLKITDHAIREELRHYNKYGESCEDGFDCRRKVNRIKNLHKYRKSCTLKEALVLFNRPWSEAYGGQAWADICREAINLKEAIKKNDLEKILMYLDRLNDLEHNTSLYLQEYCNFYLRDDLYLKSQETVEFIISKCSSEIKKLFRQNWRS